MSKEKMPRDIGGIKAVYQLNRYELDEIIVRNFETLQIALSGSRSNDSSLKITENCPGPGSSKKTNPIQN